MTVTRRAVLASGGLAVFGLLAGCTTGRRRDPDGSEGSPDAGGNGGAGGDGSGEDPVGGANDGGDGGEGPDSGPPGGGNGGDDTGATRPEGTGGPGVSIVSRDPVPGISIEPTVTVEDAVATVAGPPRLRLTLTNTGTAPVSFGDTRAAVFAYRNSTSDQLTLLPSAFEYQYAAERGCWGLEDPVDVTQEYRTGGLEPGDSFTRVLSVYGAAGRDACLPVGEHRFETAIGVAPLGEVPQEEVPWGFNVLLE